MKFFIIIMLGAFASVFTGCKDMDCHPAYIHASFTDTSQIEKSFNEEFQRNYFEIKPGNNIVFKLIMQKAQCDGIYDDEHCEFLYFEIDKLVEKFELSPENFLQAGCFYRESAAWHTPAFMEISQGLITGEKISEKDWLIHISVTPTSMYPEFPHSSLEYKGVFRKEM